MLGSALRVRMRLGTLRVPLATCALVSVLALLPLIRDPWFYYTDDAATQILPMWHALGDRILAGSWPPLLDMRSWMGGNLAMEALFGVWNPANAVLWIAVSWTSHLAVAATVVRIVAFVLLSAGSYALCREYGGAPWASGVMATAFPFCGPLFSFDAAKWPAAMLAFGWIPFLWLAARRMVRGVTNAGWVFVLGALTVTAGNPYTTLAACILLLGMHIETAVARRWRALRRLVLTSVAIGCVAPLVYLPLILSAQVTWRTPMAIGYSGVLTPHLRDVANLSIPGYVPAIPGVTSAAVYLCWFALPLAAWLDWSVLRRRWRQLVGPLVVAGAFLLMARGPSELWMFRWPLRVLHYSYLGTAIGFAVLLSAGLRVRPLRWRLPSMAGLLLVDTLLMTALVHDSRALWRDAASLCLVALLGVIAVWAYCRHGSRWLGATLQAGTVVTFALQVVWFLDDHAAIPYYFPPSLTEMRTHFAHRYRGEVLQIADTDLIGPPDQPRAAWRDLLPGNLYRPAGIEAVGSYTGMGFLPFARTLCMNQTASTCAAAYDTLWRQVPGTRVPLADLLQLSTVVVQRKLIEEPRTPQGWLVTARNERVTILQRVAPLAWPDGRLSWTSPDVRVVANTAPGDRHEVVRFDRVGPGPGRLVFARLAWPGYRAKVGTVDATVREGPAGLLEVDLPAHVSGSGGLDITWQAPGSSAGLALAAAGCSMAILLGLLQKRDSPNGTTSDDQAGIGSDSPSSTPRKPFGWTTRTAHTPGDSQGLKTDFPILASKLPDRVQKNEPRDQKCHGNRSGHRRKWRIRRIHPDHIHER